MMEIGHLSPRQVDEMSLWEVNAIVAYHNDRNAADDEQMPSDAEIDDLAAFLADDIAANGATVISKD